MRIISDEKRKSIASFREHVSSGKAKFFSDLGMDMVMGDRQGAFLADMDGQKKLFNLHCNGGVFNLGHRNPELIKLLIESLATFDIGNHHLMSRVRAQLAELIATLMPGDLNYTVFGVGGGEAVDLAIKVARAWSGRKKIVSARGGYHGHTGLAVATGDRKYSEPFGVSSDGFVQVPFGDLSALESAMGDDAAAVILETIPATLGIVVPSRDYLPAVRDLCSKNGTLLILDEIQTGLGRTGKLWGFEQFRCDSGHGCSGQRSFRGFVSDCGNGNPHTARTGVSRRPLHPYIDIRGCRTGVLYRKACDRDFCGAGVSGQGQQSCPGLCKAHQGVANEIP